MPRKCPNVSRHRARGGRGAEGASAPPPPHFFGNFKELLRKRCFQPPTSGHFESLVSPPHFRSSSASPAQYTLSFFGFTKTVKRRGNEVPVHISEVIEEEEIAKRIQCLHCSNRFQPQSVLNLFLFFGRFQPQCFY